MGEVQSISDFLFPFLVTFSAAMCYAKCMSHISFPKSTRHTLLPFFYFHLHRFGVPGRGQLKLLCRGSLSDECKLGPGESLHGIILTNVLS